MTPLAATSTRDVSETYSHYDKFVTTADTLVLPETTLKWYKLAVEGEPVPADIEDVARRCLKSESDSGKLQEFGDLGFVILHRCGQDFYFLLVSSWRNNNEIWETVYAKDGDKQKDFSRFESGIHHRPTFCVWELAVVMHEKDAWRRFLLSERGVSDRLDYLDDTYTGAA